jgi:hypothetical protein
MMTMSVAAACTLVQQAKTPSGSNHRLTIYYWKQPDLQADFDTSLTEDVILEI